MRRLYRHSNRLLIVPMDHGVSIGAVEGLKNIAATVQAVFDGKADAVIVHKGLTRYLHKLADPARGEVIVHLSASTHLSPAPNRKELVSSVQHALRLGATAVSVHVNLGDPHEPDMLRDLGTVAEECEVWGMPLLAMMYVRGGDPGSEFDPVKIAHAARVAEELGADLVKVNYTGSPETFREVTSSVHIPVLIAGGPKMGSLEELLDMIQGALEAGAGGVSIGRNIFQASEPTALVRKIRDLLDAEARCDIERR